MHDVLCFNWKVKYTRVENFKIPFKFMYLIFFQDMSFGEKCIVCGKDASAACQQCAKVFFCSNECGVS